MAKATKKKASKKFNLKNFLSNPRNVILVAFIVVFAGFGSYKVYQSSAAIYKVPDSVENCYVTIVTGDRPAQTTKSNGPCVKILSNALLAIDSKYDAFGSDGYWISAADRGQLSDDRYGDAEGRAVASFQKFWNRQSQIRGWKEIWNHNISPISQTAGAQTWAALLTVCNNSTATIKAKCGL